MLWDERAEVGAMTGDFGEPFTSSGGVPRPNAMGLPPGHFEHISNRWCATTLADDAAAQAKSRRIARLVAGLMVRSGGAVFSVVGWRCGHVVTT